MSLAAALSRAAGPRLTMVILCRRCCTLRAPGPDLGRALCRRCLEETQDLFRDETTGDGSVLGNA